MKPTMTINVDEFRHAMRGHLVNSSRELWKAINSRNFALWLRMFALLPPASPAAARAKIKAYMDESVVYKNQAKNTKARSSGLQRKHLIAQAILGRKGEKGLYGKPMTKWANKVSGGAQRSVGYMKAAIIKAMRGLNGSFTQHGRAASKSGKKAAVKANSMFSTISAQYGQGAASVNVGTFKSSKGIGTPARPGWNPISTVGIEIGSHDQSGFFEEQYAKAYRAATMDEISEMTNHIRDVLDATK